MSDSSETKYPALFIVHWPGKDVAACTEHADKLRAVGATLGLMVSMTPSLEYLECSNCRNEANKAKRNS